jgi:hypothetical protein
MTPGKLLRSHGRLAHIQTQADTGVIVKKGNEQVIIISHNAYPILVCFFLHYLCLTHMSKTSYCKFFIRHLRKNNYQSKVAGLVRQRS